MKTKRILSLLLALVLLLGVLPFSAFAEEKEEVIPEAETTAAAELPTEETSGEGEATAPASTEVEATTAAEETQPPEETAESMPDPNTEPAEETTAETLVQETEETALPETAAAEPEETEEAPMKAPSRASSNGLYTWGEYVLNYDKYYTFPNGGHVYGLPRIDYNGAPAFCIEPGVTAANGVNTVRNRQYAVSHLGSNGTAKYNAITLALAYGWPNVEYATSNTGYVANFTGTANAKYREMEKYAATQIIIWEIALGYRSCNAPYTVTDSSFFNRYYTTAWGDHWANLKSVYDQIGAKMAQHENRPSFAAPTPTLAKTYEMVYNSASGNYVLTLEDTNKTLSGFSLSSNTPGVTFSKSGNTLTVTATPEAAAKLQGGLACQMTNSSLLSVDPDTAALVYGNSGSQTIVLPNRFDPGRAYFKIKAAAASAAKVVKQNSEEGGRIANFTFELRDSSGNVLETKVTDGSGNLTFGTNLIIGNAYTIHEVTASGFVPQPDQSFTAKAGDNVVTFVNTKVYGNVQVVKVDQETGVHLTGATFKIYWDGNGNGELEDSELASATTLRETTPGVYGLENLVFGQYLLQEVQAPEGYVLDRTVYSFAITEDGETVVVETAAGSGIFENQRIYGSIKGYKLDRETGENICGAVFGLFHADETSFTEDTALMTAESDENGVFIFENVVYGGYIIRELKPAEGYLPNEEIYPGIISENEQVVEITVENDRIPTVRTTATVDGEKEVYATEVFTLTDTVSYQHLIPGKEYVLKGILMDKRTGEPFLENGEEITSEVTFVPEAPSGSVEVLFTFDAKLIQSDTSLVVFEGLYQDSKELAVHADLKDEGQTVTVHVPEIKTTASVNGKKEITTVGKVTIEDVVSYTGLIPGREYTIKGVLMNKAIGKAFLANGKEVTAEAIFTPEAKDGQVTVQFVFNASCITRSTKLVVFENVYHEDVEIAVHADINDEGQTVTVTPPLTPPDTGDHSLPIWGWLTVGLLAAAGAAVLILRKKKQ